MRLLHQALYDHFCERAQNVRVECLTVGLSYSAVITDDGGMGLAYTYTHNNTCCSMRGGYQDYEGKPAVELLADIRNPDPLRRSMALALVNALNYERARSCPEDPTDSAWMDSLEIGRGTRVAMVGFFRPLMHAFSERGAEVQALDEFQGIGEKDGFYGKLGDWAEVLLLTSTSILNDSTEEILEHISPKVKVMMIGPSTPLAPEAFRHLPVRILAGTLPVDKDRVLKAVRHGVGTPVIHRFSRKVTMDLA